MVDESDFKELGKMAGVDLIAVAELSKYVEKHVNKYKESRATMEVRIQLLDLETGTNFLDFTVLAYHDVKGKQRFPIARSSALNKFVDNFKVQINEKMAEFPWESKGKFKRGSLYLSAGIKGGVQNDMILDVILSEEEWDDDEEEYYTFEETVGQIVVSENNLGKKAKAGTRSKCTVISGNLTEGQSYVIRIPKNIQEKMRCK